MKTDFLRTACALAATAALFFSGSVQAQDIHLASTAELNNVYARLADLETRLAASNVAGGGGCGCDDVCDSCCDDCCRAGWVGGGEILFLKAFAGDGVADLDYKAAFRGWIGYQRDDGLGVRARFFDYNDQGDDDAFDITHFDLEIYDAFQLTKNWDAIIGAGIRYIDITGDLDNVEDGEFRGTGVGPVVTAELYRHVNDRLALYAIGRQSMVVSDFHVGDDFEEEVENSIFATTEIQLGAQMHRDWNGAYLFGRMGWESQYYYDLTDFNESPFGLMGVAFSAGILR